MAQHLLGQPAQSTEHRREITSARWEGKNLQIQNTHRYSEMYFFKKFILCWYLPAYVSVCVRVSDPAELELQRGHVVARD